jgi:anti-sigma regulatory factor (Ser/Thr protein kinase)
MRELSLHILDVVENGITAGGDCIWIEVDEDHKKDQLKIVIRDNGHGMLKLRPYFAIVISTGRPLVISQRQ